jgi:hypothetical protein
LKWHLLQRRITTVNEPNKESTRPILATMIDHYKAHPPSNKVVLIGIILVLALIGSIRQSCQGDKKSEVYDPQAIHARVVAEAQAKKKQEAAEATALAASDAARAAQAKQDADKRDAERAAEHKAIVDEYRVMSASQRLSAVASVCTCDNGCEQPRADCLQESAATPAEAAQLKSSIARIEKLHEQAETTKKAAEAQKARKEFASTYETLLLEKHMNPDGVSAEGKTLRVRGWFCSRQFIYDFQKSTGDIAKGLGFTKVDCNSGLEDWSVDL